MKHIKDYKSYDLVKEDGGGLMGMAVGMGIPAIGITTAFIYSVRKYKKENPDVSWKEAISTIWDETAKGAHADRKNIG